MRFRSSISLLATAIFAVASAFGATTQTTKHNDHQVIEITFKGVVPTSPASLTTTEYRVKAIILTNSTASTVTCTVTDNSTDCGGSACDLVPSSPTPLSIASGTVYSVPMFGVPATGGITWSCSGSGVIGRILVSP